MLRFASYLSLAILICLPSVSAQLEIADEFPAIGIIPPENYSPILASSTGSDTQYVFAESDEVSAPTVPGSSGLTEEDVRKVVKKYLDEKAASDEAKMTPKERKEKELQMFAKWNDGLEIATKNKHFRTHIGGRFQFDTAWFNAPANVNSNINVPYADGTDFRRARLRIDGTYYEVHEFACEYDFVNSVRIRNQPGTTNFFDEAATAPTDLWYQINEFPIFGHIRIGNQKEQIGFEHIVSSRFQPFMERSYNQDTFYGGTFNGFQPGVTIFNTYGDQMGVWNLGLFKPTNSVFVAATGDGDFAASGRITRLLLWEDDGARLIHLGLSGRQGTAVAQAGQPDRLATFRTRDAVRAGLSAGWPVPAGINLFGDDMQTANAEFVAVNGRWTLQSEYLVNALQDARVSLADPSTNVTYHGGYIQLMCFLTGEHDNYNRKTGVFERVRPTTNFFRPGRCGGICGSGAWQVGFRYNHLDLNDRGLNGGILDNYVTGLNWFWNPNVKWQFNHSITDRDVSAVAGRTAGSGTIHGFGTRVAIDF